MRTLIWTALLAFSLTGCASTKTVDHVAKKPVAKPATTKQKSVKKKNPIAVTFYNKGQTPAHPYKVIGTETVSKFNLVGIKRQEASIQDAMRNLAASMGGDAVIDIERNEKSVSGTVIGYQSKEETEMVQLKSQG